MEYDQRMIIPFPLNEAIDARDIADGLQAQFHEHAYPLQTIRLWVLEVRLGCQDLYDEISTGRFLLNDLHAKIRLYQTNLFLNQLVR
jgi:hypothetical protein